MFAGLHILVDMDTRHCPPDCVICAVERLDAARARIKDARLDVIAPVEDHAGMEALIEAHGKSGG
jgi:hypothetical protein